MLDLIIKSLYFALPLYFANMAPVFFKNRFKFLAYPLDLRKKYKRKRIFGDHKTFRGLIVGIILSLIVGLIQIYLYRYQLFSQISIINYNTISLWFFIAIGFGALLGDAVESFFKRRADIKPGARWFPFDQFDFIIGGLLLGFFFYIPQPNITTTVLIVSPIGHILINHIGFYLKIRKTKW